MAIKTQPTKQSVVAFIKSVDNETRKKDAKVLLNLFKEVTGEKPLMWGDSIIGFGRYPYQTSAGPQGDWFYLGFSPRKAALSLYLTCDLDQFEDLLKDLGPHKRGRGCLYVKKLEDIDMKVLKKLLKVGLKSMKALRKEIGVT